MCACAATNSCRYFFVSATMIAKTRKNTYFVETHDKKTTFLLKLKYFCINYLHLKINNTILKIEE